MAVMLERWNDDKMDGLAAKVDGLGDQMREQRREMREFRVEMGEMRKEMRMIRAEMVDLRKETSAGLERLGRTMAQGAVGLAGSVVIGFGALIGLIATQL